MFRTGIAICALFVAGVRTDAQENSADEVLADAVLNAGPYARWSQGPPTDPNWFPIGVWLQDPVLAPRYAELGVNTFVGLWKGPTSNQLRDLRKGGMRVVCGMNRVGYENRDNPDIIAWMQVDEPDNRARDHEGPVATPARLQENYETIVERDPTRPVWMNLGQGVANDEWKGIGTSRSAYPAYVSATDIVSFDVYPVTNIRKSDGENYLWWVPKGVKRLREWGGDQKIVWNFIECTRGPLPQKKPTPEQVRAEVWMSLIAGSRGLVYFCHEFYPDVQPSAVLDDREMSSALTSINAEVLRFAPVLNSATLATSVVTRSTIRRIPVLTMLKEHDGYGYLFAACARNGATDATMTIDGLGSKDVEVLLERRSVKMNSGTIIDAFGPYAVHIYRWKL